MAQSRAELQKTLESRSTSEARGRPGSCEDVCGEAPPDESCWCDDSCEYYDDCCADYWYFCEEESNDSEDEDEDHSPGGPPTFNITDVSAYNCVRSNGGLMILRMGTVNTFPKGPIDNLWADFGSLHVQSGSDETVECEFALDLEWTPGSRLVLDSLAISGYRNLKDSEDLYAEMGVNIYFDGDRETDRSLSFEGGNRGGYSKTWSLGSSSAYSDCSGQGQAYITITANIIGDLEYIDALLAVDTLNTTMRLAQPGETPSCG